MPTQPAVLGSARLNNFRLGYEPAALAAVRATRVSILIAGVQARRRVRMAGLTIRDLLNDAPNTCSLVVDGTAPSGGQDLRITINSDTPRLLFTGTLQSVDVTYEGKPSQVAWRCTAIDDTARLNRLRPFGTFVNVSATTVAQTIIASFAPGFTATHVQAALPAISIIFDGSESFSTCLARIKTLIGGYTYTDDLDVHLFLTEATDAPLDLDTTPGRFLDSPPIHAVSDDSQLRTRLLGKGHGEGVPADVAAGETIVPLDDAVMFGTVTAGGRAIAGTTPDGAQSQRLLYTGVILGGVGSLVGPGWLPPAPATLALSYGSGLGTGVYQYAYSQVSAAGESKPSPLAAITTGVISAPSVAPTVTDGGAGGSANYGNSILYEFVFTFVTITGETTPSPIGSITFASGPLHNIQLSNIAAGPPGVIWRKLYRRTPTSGGVFVLLNTSATLNDNTTLTFFTHGLESTGAAAPGSNTATGFQQIAVAGIAIGPANTTARKVYRTAAGGSTLQFVATIADNTTTTYVDATADGSLGATAPTSDTSGLGQPQGEVLAGSTSLPIATVSAFPAAGWVRAGEQILRYTGISGNTLTGIPASGTGAIVSSVPFGSAIAPAPMLTGVTGLTLAMLKGTPVSIWVQRDDLSAQAALVAIDAAQGRVSTGVVDYTITDERRGEASLNAVCDAHLALFSRPLVTVAYACRDVKTKSGKPIVVTLASPPISQTLVIQEVTITEIDIAPGTAPRFTASASTVRFSFDDLLRRLAAGVGTT